MSSSCADNIPPFHGYVDTTLDALRVIYAARHGAIPRITRRLQDQERRAMIQSGAVFVFAVKESQIKRWTDGMLWSPSRIVGNFLVYKEINERGNSRSSHRKNYSDDLSTRSPTISRPPVSKVCDQGSFKIGGFIKKTITVTIDGSDLHLISYYTAEDIKSGKLMRPTARSDIMNLYLPPHLFRHSNFRVAPKIETGLDGKQRFVPDSEFEDRSMVACKLEDADLSVSSNSPTSPLSPVASAYTSSMGSSFPGSQLLGECHSERLSMNDRWTERGSTSFRQLDAPVTTSSIVPTVHGIESRPSDWAPSSHTQVGYSPPEPRWQSSNVYDARGMVDHTRVRMSNALNSPRDSQDHTNGYRYISSRPREDSIPERSFYTSRGGRSTQSHSRPSPYGSTTPVSHSSFYANYPDCSSEWSSSVTSVNPSSPMPQSYNNHTVQYDTQY